MGMKGNETVCIIPDGSVWEVPFQALQAMDNRYLLQDYALILRAVVGCLKRDVEEGRQLSVRFSFTACFRKSEVGK